MRAFILCLFLGSSVLFAACQSQKTEAPSAQNTPDPVPPAIAPGHVSLKGTLKNCSEAPRAQHCTLTVASVFEYGAGTVQLPAGTSLLVSVRPQVIATFQEASGADPIGQELSMVIIAERPAPDDDTLPAWRVASIDIP